MVVLELSKELEEIRVTGGESNDPSIYKLFDWFKETDESQCKKYVPYKQQLNG